MSTDGVLRRGRQYGSVVDGVPGVRRVKPRLYLLAASTSLAALLVGSGDLHALTMCKIDQNGGTVASVSNSSPAGNCIIVDNANVSGNVSNTSTGVLTAHGFFLFSSATGITVNHSTIGGTVTNSGTINALSSGIRVEDSAAVLGGVTNSGAITTGNVGTNSGIYIGANQSRYNILTFAGNLSNSGTIMATVYNGIRVDGVEDFAANIANSGTISAAGFGIVLGTASPINVSVSTFAGSITNSGTISGGHGAINASDVSYFLGGITNTGTLLSNPSFGIGLVVDTVSVFSGNISNSGSIAAGVTGIRVNLVGAFGGASAGGITNSGTISVGYNGITAADVGTYIGGITNTGTITAGANGIIVAGISTFFGGVTNAGTITGTGQGIFVDGNQVAFSLISTVGIGNFYNGITNSGAISVGSNGIFVGSNGYVYNGAGYPITISNFSGGISNSGTISAGGNGIIVGGHASNASPVTISTFSGGITNSGVISAAGNGIFVGGSGTVNSRFAFSTFSGNITNTGTIVAPAGVGIEMLNVSTFVGGISNNGTITASVGIAVTNSGAVSVFDSGFIEGTSGTAVDLSHTGPGNTFTLGPGYSFGTGTELVVGSGSDTFQLGGSGSGSFNLASIGSGEQYRGFSTFNVVGGTWTASGSFSGSQAWNVNGGTLAGTGTFAGIDVNSGGTLEPGLVGQPGTFMTLTGSLAFQPGAIYLVNINPTTASRANVSGTVSLNGAVQGFLTPGSYSTKTTYDILDQSGYSGAFTGFSAINAPGFGGTLTNQTNDVLLNLTAQIGSGGGLNENQQNVANAINTYFNNGGALPASLFTVFQANPGNTLNLLDGQDATGAQNSAFTLMNQFLELLLDPSIDGRGGSSPTGGMLGFAPDQQESVPLDLAFVGLMDAQPQQTFAQHWSTWASGFGGSATTNGDPTVGSNNLTTNTYGYATGMDYRYSPGTVLGFSLAGSGTTWNLAQGFGAGRSDAFMAGVYGVTHSGPAYLATALAFANQWFTTNRTAFAGDQLTASFQGQSYSVRLEGGYRFALPGNRYVVGVTPYAAIQAQDFRTPAFSETDLTGGGFGLSYDAMNGTDMRSELGGRFDDLTTLDNMPLILRAKVAWAHDWVSNPALNASFESLPGTSFTVNGAPIPPNSALASAGAQLFFTSSWSLLAKFDGEFAPASQTYAGSGTLRYSW